MFGDVLRRYRRQFGLTQEELAALAGVNVRSIGKLEAGRIAAPRSATVRPLADAFGLSGVDRDRFRAAAAPVAAERLRSDGFVGRADTLGRLTARLDAHHERPRTMLIVAIAGAAGVGKTALARRWAHDVRRRFADGQLYLNLRGADPAGAMTPAEALGRLLGALGVPPRRIPAEQAAQTALYRSLLADRRTLVLLDNAHDAAQVRPLLPGSAGCMTLVTSREPLTGLVATDGAEPLTLDELNHAESMRLVEDRLGAEDSREAIRIVERYAGLPLALTIAAAAPPRPAGTGAVADWSYRALSPDAAQLFRLVGTQPADLTTPAAASLAGLPAARAGALLTELTGARLLTEVGSGRYTCHDLVRAYAARLAETVDSRDDRREATLRLVDHYLHTAYAGARLLQPRTIALDPAPRGDAAGAARRRRPGDGLVHRRTRHAAGGPRPRRPAGPGHPHLAACLGPGTVPQPSRRLA